MATDGSNGMDATVLCETHRDLPARVAAHLAHRYPVPAGDIEPAAWEGLWRAAQTWRPDGGMSFRRWAWARITETIIDGIREERGVPRPHWRRQRAINTATETLRQQHARDPTRDEVRAAAGLTPRQWGLWRDADAALRPISIDAHPLDWPDHTAPDPDRLDEWVRAAAAALPPQEATVIAAIYWSGKTQTEVAADLRVTGSRVCQIHRAAVDRMRDAIRWHLWRDPGRPLTGALVRRRDAYRHAVAQAHDAAPRPR